LCISWQQNNTLASSGVGLGFCAIWLHVMQDSQDDVDMVYLPFPSLIYEI